MSGAKRKVFGAEFKTEQWSGSDSRQPKDGESPAMLWQMVNRKRKRW